MDVPAIAKVAFTSEDRVRDVIRNRGADGFASLYPKYKGGHPPKFTLPQRREIKKIAKSRPARTTCRFPPGAWPSWRSSWWRGVDDISHQGLRVLLRQEGASFQRLKTWKASKDPRYAAKKARIEHLYAIADREITPKDDEPGGRLLR
jgi:transposase